MTDEIRQTFRGEPHRPPWTSRSRSGALLAIGCRPLVRGAGGAVGARRGGTRRSAAGGWLDRIERAGNALPDPATLFAIGALLVALGSELAFRLDWQIEKTVSQPVAGNALDAHGQPLMETAVVACTRRRCSRPTASTGC